MQRLTGLALGTREGDQEFWPNDHLFLADAPHLSTPCGIAFAGDMIVGAFRHSMKARRATCRRWHGNAAMQVETKRKKRSPELSKLSGGLEGAVDACFQFLQIVPGGLKRRF